MPWITQVGPKCNHKVLQEEDWGVRVRAGRRDCGSKGQPEWLEDALLLALKKEGGGTCTKDSGQHSKLEKVRG